jgi:hypothetical protein
MNTTITKSLQNESFVAVVFFVSSCRRAVTVRHSATKMLSRQKLYSAPNRSERPFRIDCGRSQLGP